MPLSSLDRPLSLSFRSVVIFSEISKEVNSFVFKRSVHLYYGEGLPTISYGGDSGCLVGRPTPLIHKPIPSINYNKYVQVL